jgi:hypothetical protein
MENLMSFDDCLRRYEILEDDKHFTLEISVMSLTHSFLFVILFLAIFKIF